MKFTLTFFSVYLIVIHTACQPTPEVISPPQYDLKKPTIFKMPQELDEISGITFPSDRNDIIYAIQDENGVLYKYDFENGISKSFKFAKRGDYEDVAVTDEYLIVLKSDGSLFTLILNDVVGDKEPKAQELKDILPKGEYEGMFADNAHRQLYVLCKHCSGDKEAKKTSGYILTIATNGEIHQSGQFSINVKDIETVAKVEKIHFQPSALAKNKATNEWYILSSANNALVVTDSAWAVKAAYPLPKTSFRQPEGMVFDNAGNLYISNERANGTSANILKFIFKKTN